MRTMLITKTKQRERSGAPHVGSKDSNQRNPQILIAFETFCLFLDLLSFCRANINYFQEVSPVLIIELYILLTYVQYIGALRDC
jgi:hypothetical protein